MWPGMASTIPYPGPKPYFYHWLTLFNTVWYCSIRPEPYLQFHSSSATGLGFLINGRRVTPDASRISVIGAPTGNQIGDAHP
jgi:hypothetical protein